MRSIRFDGPAAFANIFSAPFRVADHATAPDVVASWHFPDDTPAQQPIVAQELGLSPSQFIVNSRYAKVPDAYIHEVREARLHNGMSFSCTGDIFPDNANICSENGDAWNFQFGEHSPVHLGNGYFAHNRRPLSSSYNTIDHPCVIFDAHGIYGHYLLESLPLLWTMEEGFSFKLAFFPWKKTIDAYLLGMIAPFGLASEDICITEEFSLIKTLYLIRRPYMIKSYASNKIRSVYKKVATYYHGKDTALPKRIYVSRRKVAKRMLINESACEEVFASYGFTSVCPEMLSFPDQVRLFSNATHIAGPVGSALHNVVFSLRPEEMKVLFLTPERFPPEDFCQVEQLYGRTPMCVYGKYASAVSRETWYKSPWSISIDNLKKAIEQWLAF